MLPFNPYIADPHALSDREQARRHPEAETLALGALGAARALGRHHSVTKALAKASVTMTKADLWLARLAVKTLRRDQRAGKVPGPRGQAYVPPRPLGGSENVIRHQVGGPASSAARFLYPRAL